MGSEPTGLCLSRVTGGGRGTAGVSRFPMKAVPPWRLAHQMIRSGCWVGQAGEEQHISPSANTSNPLFNCTHTMKTHFTPCQHLKPPFQLPPCPQNIIHPVTTPHTPLSIAPMPSTHISPNANTSNPLFNCHHALKTYFTQCQHLKPPFRLPPCPQNTFHPVTTPQTLFSTAPMPSKHISHSANTSKPLFNCPHALKTHFTHG